MAKYLLAVHTVEDEVRPPIDALEDEMASAGAWVFSGRLTQPSDATVVATSGAEVVMTDGPFAESKEHLAGFYVIEAADQDAALGWAAKVTAAIGAPIETRPFWGTGRVSEQATASS